MKWLTTKQVKKHATTPTKARNISEKHHQQICDATAKEIREYVQIFPNIYLLCEGLCGLCVYWESCESCPLALINVRLDRCKRVGSQYHVTTQAYNNWLNCKGSFQTFKKQERKMLKLIKSLKGKK